MRCDGTHLSGVLLFVQMGSYFGSALCAVDLNGDGLSDLLVGAPMHTSQRDEGQVTLYLSRANVRGSVCVCVCVCISV